MIGAAALHDWRQKVFWREDSLVEQDLVICRALITLFSHPVIAETFAFIGGTALHKLHIQPGGRYSEDIDLTQLRPVDAESMVDLIVKILGDGLGEPEKFPEGHKFKILYKFPSIYNPPATLKLKIDSQWDPAFKNVEPLRLPFKVENPWFGGETLITTLPVNELIGGKMRAAYYRGKVRDIFDLSYTAENGVGDPRGAVDCFERATAGMGKPVSRFDFDESLRKKARKPKNRMGMEEFLRRGKTWDIDKAMDIIMKTYSSRFTEYPGNAREHGDGIPRYPGSDNRAKEPPGKPAPPDRGEER